ncbi:MAG: YlmH/Sll1252 family protein [Oscillospiraceae bacterium]
MQQLKKRFEELAGRAAGRGCWTFSEFLNLAEQDTLCRLKLDAPFALEGGYPSAERKIAMFGSESDCAYLATAPICCLCVTPLSQKFADALTHRDFLGALTGLGIRREVLGDIIVSENRGYVFCLETMADYIREQFTQVKHTSVKVSLEEAPPPMVVEPPEITRSNIASERLDAIVAAVYKLSRGESQKLFEQGKIFVNSRMTENTSAGLKPGDMISVRGMGRFSYEGIEAETRKGRLRVNVRIY